MFISKDGQTVKATYRPATPLQKLDQVHLSRFLRKARVGLNDSSRNLRNEIQVVTFEEHCFNTGPRPWPVPR